MAKIVQKTKPKSSTKTKWWIAFGIVGLVAIAVVGFIAYFVYSAANPLPADNAVFNGITVRTDVKFADRGSYYAITPNSEIKAGLILYPGAFGDPRAYVDRYFELAQQGVAVFVVRSPFNFALLDTNRADRIMRENNMIDKWYVAGHSLGGVAACEFAKSNEEQLSGLILLGSFCNGNAADLTIPVLSISASRDGLSTPAKITASKQQLPADTQFIVIDGANHTQFGMFTRTQGGDNSASISDQQAQQQIITAISQFVSQR